MELPAGRYETLLPPSAVGDLFLFLYAIASGARGADEGRTVFSKPGGGNRIGEQLATVPVTLRSDPTLPGLECAPFLATTRSEEGTVSVFDNGLPLGSTEWIRDGVLTELMRTRAYAAKTDTQPRPYVDNLMLEVPGSTASTDEMVARTERGLLLTCVWYVRPVDPQTMLMTGLTRDGVYLVEDGEVTGAVNNFRWNESPVDLLGRITEAGTSRALPGPRVRRLLQPHRDADAAGARLQHEHGQPGVLTAARTPGRSDHGTRGTRTTVYVVSGVGGVVSRAFTA